MDKHFRETLSEQLQDPEFRKVWDKESARREEIRAQIEADEFALLPNREEEREENV